MKKDVLKRPISIVVRDDAQLRVVLRSVDGLWTSFPLSPLDTLPSVIYRQHGIDINHSFDKSPSSEFKQRAYKFEYVQIQESICGTSQIVCWFFDEWVGYERDISRTKL